MTKHAGAAENRTFETLPAEAMVRINQHCDEFERQRRESDTVSLDQFIDRVELPRGRERDVLVRELLLIDLHHRLNEGDRPAVADYTKLSSMLHEKTVDGLIRQACKDVGPDTGVLVPNQRIGDYMIVREAGRGGMGHVYQAIHMLMNRRVAIKILTNRVSRDPVSRRRFEREIRSVAKLNHRNIVTAFDARIEGDSLYLVTEWIEGSDLGRLVEKLGPLPVSDVITYAKQTARGLRDAHRAGLIHRDVKPGNLLVDPDGDLKILDLGLAKLLYEYGEDDADPDALTKSTQIIGTPAFLAPEQSRNALDVDLRSDIYSLGCTLFYLLAGKIPYRGDSAMDVILAHRESPTPNVRELRSDVPDRLASLIFKMMSKHPDERPATMDEVLDQLVELQPPSPTWRDSTTAIEEKSRLARIELDRPIRKRGIGMKPVGIIVAIALGLCAILFAGYRWFRDDDSIEPPIVSGGVWFDGVSSYASTTSIGGPSQEPLMIEVLVTPEQGSTPSNIVSWTGEKSLFIFTSTEWNWGIGMWDGNRSTLRIAQEPIRFGETFVISGRWDRQRMDLFVDGQRLETIASKYRLFPADPMLCFGGVPAGLFPEETGTRFFTGAIHAIRVSEGGLPSPAATPEAILHKTPSTVGMFRFTQDSEATVTGLSANRLKLDLVNTSWRTIN